jgi:hypothetical protein
MSKTYAKAYTTVSLGGNSRGNPTAILTRTATDAFLFKYLGYGKRELFASLLIAARALV